MAHLSEKVNSWHDQSVRQALAPLQQVAERTRAAILLIAHLNKTAGTDPIRRLGGSVGIAGAARSILLLGRDPDDGEEERGSRRVLAHVKSNLGSPATSLLYEVEARTITGDDGEEIETACLCERGRSPYVGSDLLVQPSEDGRSVHAEAERFLRVELAEGPKPAPELYRIAEEVGISAQTLKRAKKSVGVRSAKRGYDGGWVWLLGREEGQAE